MKKLIVMLMLLVSFNTYASRSMISLYGFNTGDDSDRSFNFEDSHGESSNQKVKKIAFNYAYAITDMFQLGVQYRSKEETTGGEIVNFGDKTSSFGVFGILNLANCLTNTPYVYLGYTLAKAEDSDELYDSDGDGNVDSDFEITLEGKIWNVGVGYRLHLGSALGLDFNFSPSLNVAFIEGDSKVEVSGVTVKDKSSYTSITLNIAKFDVLF